jgi:hypothetical protein
MEETSMNREADREHQRQRDQEDQTLRTAPEPQMSGAGDGPRREHQQHEAAGLRLFRGAGTHGR